MASRSKSFTELLSASALLALLLALGGVVFVVIKDEPAAPRWWEKEASPAEQDAIPKFSETRSENGRSLSQQDATSQKREAGTEILVKKAVELIDKGDWSAAEDLLEGILKENPRHEAALIEMGMIQLLDKQDSAAARPFLERALNVNPQNEVVLQELLGIYQDTNSWDEGLSFLRSLTPEGRDAGYLDYGIGEALKATGKPEEAVEALHRAVYEKGYQDFKVRASLGESLAAAGRADEAIREFETIIQGPYKPHQTKMAKIQMSRVLMEQKRFAEAKQILQGIQEAEPGDEWISYLLRQLHEQQAQF